MKTNPKTLFIEAFAQGRIGGAATRFVRVVLDDSLAQRLTALRLTCCGLRLQHVSVESDPSIWRPGSQQGALVPHAVCESLLQVSERGFKFVLELLPHYDRYETFFIGFDELASLQADPSATLFYTLGPTEQLRAFVRDAGEDLAGEVKSLAPVSSRRQQQGSHALA